MSTFETALVLVGAAVGSGIIAIPYACSRLGLFLSIGSFAAFGGLSHLSTLMHLKIKDLTPNKHESIYEIAYLLLGRPALFTVLTVQYVINCAIIIL